MSSRDVGKIRCTASVVGKGLSISCTAELRLNRSSCNLETSTLGNVSTKIGNEMGANYVRGNPARRSVRNVPSPRCEQYESPMRTRSSSLTLKSTPSSKQSSPLPTKRIIPPSPLLDSRRTIVNKTNKRTEPSPKKAKRNVVRLDARSNNRRVSSSSDEEGTKGVPVRRLSSKVSNETNTKLTTDAEEFAKSPTWVDPDLRKTENDSKQSRESSNDNLSVIYTECAPVTEETLSISKRNGRIATKVEENFKDASEEFVVAAILKVSADVTVFRGNRVVLRATYRGHPEPRVKWFRAVNIFLIFYHIFFPPPPPIL